MTIIKVRLTGASTANVFDAGRYLADKLNGEFDGTHIHLTAESVITSVLKAGKITGVEFESAAFVYEEVIGKSTIEVPAVSGVVAPPVAPPAPIPAPPATVAPTPTKPAPAKLVPTKPAPAKLVPKKLSK